MKTIPFDINKVKVGTPVWSNRWGRGYIAHIINSNIEQFPIITEFYTIPVYKARFTSQGFYYFNNKSEDDINIIEEDIEITKTIHELYETKEEFNKMIDERIKQLQNQ